MARELSLCIFPLFFRSFFSSLDGIGYKMRVFPTWNAKRGAERQGVDNWPSVIVTIRKSYIS